MFSCSCLPIYRDFLPIAVSCSIHVTSATSLLPCQRDPCTIPITCLVVPVSLCHEDIRSPANEIMLYVRSSDVLLDARETRHLDSPVYVHDMYVVVSWHLPVLAPTGPIRDCGPFVALGDPLHVRPSHTSVFRSMIEGLVRPQDEKARLNRRTRRVARGAGDRRRSFTARKGRCVTAVQV